ncbi:MAG: IS110 family transposase [Phycisphaerae bacterium]
MEKPATYVVGLDVHKYLHVTCIMDRHDTIRARLTFPNTRPGLEQLLAAMRKLGRKSSFLIGMEASGPYWFSLYEHLKQETFRVVTINPLQTRKRSKEDIRVAKTDRLDARRIAQILLHGENRPTLVPSPKAMTLRQLLRTRHALVQKKGDLKRLLLAQLHPVWPEYETLFCNPFIATSRQILESARNAFTCTALLDAAEQTIPQLIRQIDTMDQERATLEETILTYADKLPTWLDLPGLGPLMALTIWAETDPIKTFNRPRKLVAFAGLDLTIGKSGQGPYAKRKLSKRGSPYLRYALYMAAESVRKHAPDIMKYYDRLRNEGFHHIAATCCVARKLCYVLWRLAQDNRKYKP